MCTQKLHLVLSGIRQVMANKAKLDKIVALMIACVTNKDIVERLNTGKKTV